MYIYFFDKLTYLKTYQPDPQISMFLYTVLNFIEVRKKVDSLLGLVLKSSSSLQRPSLGNGVIQKNVIDVIGSCMIVSFIVKSM